MGVTVIQEKNSQFLLTFDGKTLDILNHLAEQRRLTPREYLQYIVFEQILKSKRESET